jgi:uncharacterized protein (TIGR00369 family)
VTATEDMHQVVPFTGFLGIELLENSATEVRGRLAWSEALTTTGGAMNGGALMGLADNVGALCAFHNLPDGSTGTTTIESKTNFLRAVRGGYATAVARPLHTGRRIVVIETDIRDDEDRLVAKVTQTQAVL